MLALNNSGKDHFFPSSHYISCNILVLSQIGTQGTNPAGLHLNPALSTTVQLQQNWDTCMCVFVHVCAQVFRGNGLLTVPPE